MKSILKNSLKAICYVLLFVGIQYLTGLAAMLIYGIIAGVQAGMAGVEVDVETVTMQILEVYLDNVNWISFVSGGITILVLWLFFVIRRKKLLTEVGIVQFEKKKIIPCVLLGIVLSFFVTCVLNILPIPEEVWESYAESSQSILSGSLASRICGIVIMAPLVEEIMFRGLVLSRLKRAMRASIAVVVSSLLFGVMHGHPLWIAYAALTGIMLAVVAEKTKSVGASILVHMAFNSVSVWAPEFNPTGVTAYLIGVVTLLLVVCCCLYIFKNPADIREEKTDCASEGA